MSSKSYKSTYCNWWWKVIIPRVCEFTALFILFIQIRHAGEPDELHTRWVRGETHYRLHVQRVCLTVSHILRGMPVGVIQSVLASERLVLILTTRLIHDHIVW